MVRTESLPCALTESEWNDRSSRLAEIPAKLDKLEVDKKTSADEFKKRIEYLEGDMRAIAKQVRERSEDRDVETEERHDDIRCCVETVRLDTGEVVRSRPMSQAEIVDARQEALPGIGKRRRRGTTETKAAE